MEQRLRSRPEAGLECPQNQLLPYGQLSKGYVRATKSCCLIMIERAFWHNPNEVGRGLDVFRERTLICEGTAVHKPSYVVSDFGR